MNRSSVAIALAGFLAACALLCAVAGFFQPLFWPAAAASGATSYLLWDYGRRHILAAGYGAAGLHEDSARGGRHRVTAEDWHHGGFEYRTGDPSPSDDDWDDWEWPGPFWRDEADRRSTGGDRTDGGDAGGPSDPWGDEENRRWRGWAEETGTDRASAGRDADADRSDERDGGRGRGRSTGGTTSERRGGERGRSSRTRQRRLTRTREEAAAVLGVAPDAPPEEVRAAYRERVMETHPDHGGDEAAFRRVRWAYDQLRE